MLFRRSNFVAIRPNQPNNIRLLYTNSGLKWITFQKLNENTPVRVCKKSAQIIFWLIRIIYSLLSWGVTFLHTNVDTQKLLRTTVWSLLKMMWNYIRTHILLYNIIIQAKFTGLGSLILAGLKWLTCRQCLWRTTWSSVSANFHWQ